MLTKNVSKSRCRADPGFFLEGGAPKRNDETEILFADASYIRKPHIISRKGGTPAPPRCTPEVGGLTDNNLNKDHEKVFQEIRRFISHGEYLDYFSIGHWNIVQSGKKQSMAEEGDCYPRLTHGHL